MGILFYLFSFSNSSYGTFSILCFPIFATHIILCTSHQLYIHTGWIYLFQGGVKVLITGPWQEASNNYSCLFDQISVPASLIQPGVLRCYCPGKPRLSKLKLLIYELYTSYNVKLKPKLLKDSVRRRILTPVIFFHPCPTWEIYVSFLAIAITWREIKSLVLIRVNVPTGRFPLYSFLVKT